LIGLTPMPRPGWAIWYKNRIWMDHSREEVAGLQRDGHGSLGKSPNSETDPNYGSGAEMRYAFEL